MDILGQSSLLVAVSSFALGFSVLARNVRDLLFITFSMLTTLVSVWSLTFFLEKMWPGYGFYRLHLFFNVLLGPASLILIRVLIRIQDLVSRKLLEISVVLAFCLSLALVMHWETVPGILSLIYFCPGIVILQTLQLMWIDRGLKKGLKRLPKLPTVGLVRRNFIYLGALIVLLTSVMDHVPWLGTVLPSFGNLALATYLFFLSQAITQQRLLNVSALFSRFLVLLVVALTLTGIYSVLFAWIENSPGLFFLNSFIVSFLLVMLLEPLRTVVRYCTQILVTKKYRRLDQTLSEAQQKLTGIVDLNSLFQVVLSMVEKTLEPEWASFFILNRDGTRFRRARTLGREPEMDPNEKAKSLKEVLADHPLLHYSEDLAQKGKFPVLLDQILENEIDRSASRVLKEEYTRLIQTMKALGGNLMIPIIDSGKMLGFVVAFVPYPPEPWGNNWGFLPMVYPYFQQAAQMMQSMEVYARQKEKDRLATLGEMAAGLAHEIRNPLGAIKGAAQFLDPATDRSDSQFLRIIVEEVDHLNHVVTQFLDYSKPPSVGHQRVNLSELAKKTIHLMSLGPNPGAQIQFAPSELPAYFLGSSEQMVQVLMNLIQNSQKAVGERLGGLIRVSVSLEGKSPHTEIVLLVEDNGHGIKKEHLEKLFIPFFTTSPSGTGLGLSISQKIVEAHQGRIEVMSEEGRFSRFSVILPYAKERSNSC